MGSLDTSTHPSVKLAQGTVVGRTLGELPRPVHAFRGIPYAQPPTGPRRFRPALKVTPSDQTIDAADYGPAAPGKPLFADSPPLDYAEDCLTANVFRPADAAAAGSLPVAVYLHGGAFNRGTASMHNTASMVAWAPTPLVAVSFNYRLGALGFLPSTASANAGVLNLGLKDQSVLLEWVRDNIAEFGGDANNVTLIGLSAGAHSIGHHLMHYTEGVPPLFHRVVIESGAPTSRAVRPYNAPVHEAQFQHFLKETGCPANLADEAIFDFLRSLPLETIEAAQNTVFDAYNPSLRWAFQPVIDGDVIPRPPLQTWTSGQWHKVPIMTGFVHNEGSLYVDKQMATGAQFTRFFADLLPLLSADDIAAIDKLYPDPLQFPASPYRETRPGVGAQYRRVEAAYAHYAYIAPVRQTAEQAASHVPVYLYQWALEATLLEGARHGDNMRYEVCDPAVLSISSSQKTLARTLNAYIASFIATGDPNAVKELERPVWEKYEPARPQALAFGAKNKELVGGEAGAPAEFVDDQLGREECRFWWAKVELSQQ